MTVVRSLANDRTLQIFRASALVYCPYLFGDMANAPQRAPGSMSNVEAQDLCLLCFKIKDPQLSQVTPAHAL
jgi:hypothetical protein